MDNGASSYRRFLEGDKDALIDIIGDYREGLVLFLNSYIGNFCLAEEITQETFIKLYAEKPKFSEKCSFKTWLYTIGKNAFLDYKKKYSKCEEKAEEIIENYY